jgi:hypothetical protein
MKTREKAIPPQAATRIPEGAGCLIDLYLTTNPPDEVTKWQAQGAMYPELHITTRALPAGRLGCRSKSYRAALDLLHCRWQSPEKDFGVCCHDPVTAVGSQFAQSAAMPSGQLLLQSTA